MANFGGSGFTADVQSLEADALQCIQEQVTQTPLAFNSQVTHQWHKATACRKLDMYLQ